jgi:hypothetical protein
MILARRIPLHAAGLIAVTAVLGGSPGSPTTKATTTGASSAPETNPVGDIPGC